jgi:hypothetical protein
MSARYAGRVSEPDEIARRGLGPGNSQPSPMPEVVSSPVETDLYGIFWWYYINREMADYGRARETSELGDDPTTSTLALFPGGLVVVPAIWTAVTTFQRSQAAQRLTGQTPLNGWLALVLALVFSPAFLGYMQSGLNSAWEAASSAVEPNAPPPEPPQ